tara:strand:+ start:82 stop:753 length:672 start_codon:yes stop_codon:yes gene_type:complete
MQNLDLTADPLSLSTLLINLGVGVLLSIMLRWHFRYFGATLSNRSEFAHVGPFILLITILIISVVKSSLALSLGLVGALSIVRFRTPIKEPEELAYLFMAIAIGLGLGANQTIPTIVVSPIILGVMAGFKLARRKSNTKNLFLSVNWKTRLSRERLDELNALIAKHTRVSDLRRFDSHDNETEATYYIDLEDSDHLFSLESNLRQIFPGVAVTFIEHSQEPTF